MEDTYLVIKIPEEIRLALINNIQLSMDQQSICDSYIKHAIINGTPLPKGHGRLMILSEDKLKENQINLDFSCQKWISEVGLSNATIATIKAHKAETKQLENPDRLKEGDDSE